MYTVLIFPGGRRADAVLLSTAEDRLRLAIAGRSDTMELTSVGGRWLSESGTPVEFGAMIAMGAAGQKQSRPRVLAVGRPS
jgi:hypothetical protein